MSTPTQKKIAWLLCGIAGVAILITVVLLTYEPDVTPPTTTIMPSQDQGDPPISSDLDAKVRAAKEELELMHYQYLQERSTEAVFVGCESKVIDLRVFINCKMYGSGNDLIDDNYLWTFEQSIDDGIPLAVNGSAMTVRQASGLSERFDVQHQFPPMEKGQTHNVDIDISHVISEFDEN